MNPSLGLNADFSSQGAEMIKRLGKTWWTFEAARNDSYMNQFSRLASLCWLANTNFSPCTRIEAVINYASKYCSKSESQTSTYVEVSKAILPHASDRNPMLSFVSKRMNRPIGVQHKKSVICFLGCRFKRTAESFGGLTSDVRTLVQTSYIVR